MGSFRVKGGNKLHGTIIPQGAKNEAMQVLCAALLTDEPVTITKHGIFISSNHFSEKLRVIINAFL